MENGLSVHVLRPVSWGDCTNGGVSSSHTDFVLVKKGEIGPSNVAADRPALYLAKWCGRVIACPVDLEKVCPKSAAPKGGMSYAESLGECTISYLGNWMFGGNFVYSSDSRFHAICDYPIPIYDRREA